MSPCHLSHPCHPHHPDHPVNTVSPQKIVGNMALMVIMLKKREGLIMMMMVVLVMMMMTNMAMMMMLAWSEREEGWLEGWLSLESASGCQYYCQHCQLNLIMMILMPMIKNHREKNNTNTATIAQFSLPVSIGWVALSFRVGLFVCPAWMTSPSVFHFVYKQMLEKCSYIAPPPGSRNHHQSRDTKSRNFPVGRISRAKTFRTERINHFCDKNAPKVKLARLLGNFPDWLENFHTVWKLSRLFRNFPDSLENFQTVRKVSRRSRSFQDYPEAF